MTGYSNRIQILFPENDIQNIQKQIENWNKYWIKSRAEELFRQAVVCRRLSICERKQKAKTVSLFVSNRTKITKLSAKLTKPE